MIIRIAKTIGKFLIGIVGMYIYYLIGAAIIIAVYAVIEMMPTILPFIGSEEYVVDKNEVIHSKYCEYNKRKWFVVKHRRYDIILEPDQRFCRECLWHEERKLMLLHNYNYDELKKTVARSKSEEYAEQYMKTNYRDKFQLDE